jgi:hypothetical protein
MEDEELQPIGRVLGDGFGIAPLPPGWTALEGVVLVKCLDVDGQPSWAFRHTGGLNHEETIGALTVQLDLMRDEITDLFKPGDEPETE